jgi:hypothetical protein
LADEDRTTAAGEFELDKAHVEFINDQALLKREELIASKFFTTSVWGTDSTPGTKWSAANSTPYPELRTGCRTIQQAVGFWPTDLILGADVWDTLADHADTLARITGMGQSTDPAVVLPSQIAQILGLKRVTIAAASYNTASAGATVSMSPLYDTNDALLIYRPDNPQKFTPSGAYTFSYSPYDRVKGKSVAIETWRDRDPDGEYFRGNMYLAPKITASEAGYFFNEATS